MNSNHTTELKIGGLGGQGVILSAIIIGEAASIFQDLHATMTQAFGPEARGSACSAQVKISKTPVAYPYVIHPDILVVMSQEAFTKFVPELKAGGLLIYESELVQPGTINSNIRAYGVPATRFAEELGRTMILNIVMVGFFTACSGILEREAVKSAVKSSVDRKSTRLNSSHTDISRMPSSA